LGSRLEAARQLKNAILGEALRRLERMRRDPAYAAAKALPRGWTKPDATPLQLVQAKARREAFSALRVKHGFREFDLHAHSSLSASSWIRQHLDINTAQKVATRAFKSAERYAFGQAGRPRFARYSEVKTVEGKSNTAGIRFRIVDGLDRILWSGAFGMLDLPLTVLPGDEVQAHGLRVAREGSVKYCRLLLRTIRGRKQAYVQLVLQGQAFRKGKHPVGKAEVGLDLGPSQVALVAEGHAEVMPFCTGLNRQEAARRRYLRKLDRQRRANNPDNYRPDGTVKPRNQGNPWRSSLAMVRTRAALAEILRALAAHRKSLQGELAHKVLAHGNRVHVEKVDKRAWSKLWGRSVGHKAPGMFQARVKILAEASGGFQDEVPTQTTCLSSRCLCGKRRKKALRERHHECGCACIPPGTWVDRDEFSAFLAVHCRKGLLDEQEAGEA
jgi:putative transposase